MQNIATRLQQVFWGLVVIALDVPLGRFDILPDCVGYVLVALGAGGLITAGRPFNLAKTLCWILVGVSAAAALFQGYFGMTLRLLQVPLDAAMMWFLLGGVIEIASSKQRPELVARANLCRIAYVAVMCVVGVTIIVARVVPNLASALGRLTFIGMLCVVAVILHLLFQLKQATSPASAPTGDAVAPQ